MVSPKNKQKYVHYNSIFRMNVNSDTYVKCVSYYKCK